MASWARRMPSSKVSSWLISVATSSVGLISSPLISEKCVALARRPGSTSSSRFLITPTVTMA